MKIITLKITKKTEKSFVGKTGDNVTWVWYKGERQDGVVMDFGSTNNTYEIGDVVDVNIEKRESSTGRINNVEVSPFS